jgi:hypothetical protein
VRTNTLVKGAVIQVDATPFRIAYEKHYGKPVTTKRRAAGQGAAEVEADVKKSGHVEKKLAGRQADSSLDPLVEQQFGSGRLYACISECSSEEELNEVQKLTTFLAQARDPVRADDAMDTFLKDMSWSTTSVVSSLEVPSTVKQALSCTTNHFPAVSWLSQSDSTSPTTLSSRSTVYTKDDILDPASFVFDSLLIVHDVVQQSPNTDLRLHSHSLQLDCLRTTCPRIASYLPV